MMRKKHVLIWVFAIFAGMLLAVAPHVQADKDDHGRVRLAGSWLVTSPAGIRGSETMSALDPSGRRVAVRLTSLSADATGMGCCPDAEYLSVAIGDAVMTGPSEFEATLMAYSMKTGAVRDEVVCIWVMDVSGTVTENTQETTTTFTIYPTSDTDVDMLPDDCDEPCHIPIPGVPSDYWPTSITLPVNATRVPMVPCE